MRERSTWDRNEVAKQAAMPKKADPYLMNQDHVKQQPAADKYVTGDPSSFGEDIHPSSGTWEAEYSGGAVKRNEIGMPEMRGDTFNHAEKTASEDVLVKKAQLCVRIARKMLPKTSSAEAVEDQGLALMHLPDAELINTFNRLAQDDDKKEAEGQQQGQAQDQKQAGEMPPQFKENAEKKKEEAEAKKDDGGQQQKQSADANITAAVACLQAGNAEGAKKAIFAAIQVAAQQIKTANDQAQQEQGQEQGQQKQAEGQPQQQMQAQGQQPQQQQAEMQQQAQQQQQLAEMVQQAAQQMQQQAQGQQPQQQQAQQQQMQAEGQPQQQMQAQQPQQQMAQQQQMQPTADDMLLDQMLADMPAQQPTADMEVELDAPSMDTGDAVLGPEDAQLMQLFANDEAQQAQQAQEQQGQPKQASIRTASTRTVGSRPTQGVSKLGGVGSAAQGGEKNLSSIWNSAPDVSSVFGISKS